MTAEQDGPTLTGKEFLRNNGLPDSLLELVQENGLHGSVAELAL